MSGCNIAWQFGSENTRVHSLALARCGNTRLRANKRYAREIETAGFFMPTVAGRVLSLDARIV
jgi:hypothetical protein